MIQDRRRWMRAPLGFLVLLIVLAAHGPLVAVHASALPAATSMPGVGIRGSEHPAWIAPCLPLLRTAPRSTPVEILL